MVKKYYSISEVAAMLDVKDSTLRFWEGEFKQLKPQLSPKGTRRYVEKDIDILRTIVYLLKEQGLTIDGARQRMSGNLEGDTDVAKVISKLQSIKSELLAIRLDINSTAAMTEDTFVDGDDYCEIKEEHLD